MLVVVVVVVVVVLLEAWWKFRFFRRRLRTLVISLLVGAWAISPIRPMNHSHALAPPRSGLFSHEIEIGEPGSEHFQIVVDEDTDLIYYPAVEDCISKTVPVKGPGTLLRGRSFPRSTTGTSRNHV